METKDLIVIGGGINGAGIAADAAGRGLSVLMLEAQDLACATSSASSKLIHGGLRYLEHYEFRLVSEALAEREVLLKMAPHIAFPMRFRLPHRPHLRPAWMIRIGLFMYDHLGKRTSLPGSTGLRFGANSVLKPEIKRGFEYSDCWVDDARLVLANAQMVVRKGGEVLTRTRATSARRENGLWIVEAEDIDTGKKYSWQARGLVNATGPWVKQFFDEGMHLPSPYGIRLIKGSHIVVPRVHTQKQAYILQNEDKRIVFVIPWMDEFSKKTLRIREEFFIPAIAGPAAAVFWIHIVYTVPVHIDNSNRERNVLFVEIFHQFHIRCFTVTPVTAPPVSECKSRKHRSFAAKVVEIL